MRRRSNGFCQNWVRLKLRNKKIKIKHERSDVNDENWCFVGFEWKEYFIGIMMDAAENARM